MALLLLVAAGVGSVLLLRGGEVTAPVPGQQRCVATANGSSVAVTLKQAHYASIIVGLSIRRGLPPRAASIALATVYQETGIRNLDYGDRDSVGLFQQRPSQGWGTRKQLRDPYYATGAFYDALVKVKGWKTGEINDVAQSVQRSGHPEAYRDHESDARVLASALTGQSPGGFSCLERRGSDGDAADLVSGLKKTLDKPAMQHDGQVVTIDAESAELAWAYASFAVANSGVYGVVSVDVGGRKWQTDSFTLPEWTATEPAARDTRVTLTVR